MVIPAYSADYLKSILNAFNDLIFLFDEGGIIIDYLQNENSQWLYLPKEQFTGKHHRDVLPPDVSKKIEEAITAIKNGERTFTFDYSLSIAGRIFWFTAVFSSMRGSVSPELGYLCVIREITQRKEKELLLQSVLDNAFNAFMVLRAIRSSSGNVIDFEWTMVNRKAEKLIGRTSSELLQTRIKGHFEEPWFLFDQYATVMETGNTLDLEYHYYRNQKTIWLHTHASRLDDGVVVTIKDISAAKQSASDLQEATEELNVSRERMELFFSQALSGFFFNMLDEPLQWDDTVDKEAALEYAIDHFHFTRVNNAMLKQYGADEEKFLQLTIKDFFTGDLDNALLLLRQLFDEGRIYVNRASRKLDGSLLWLEGNYICFRDQQNRILGYFGIQQDVTDRKYAEDALRSSEQRYRILANNMLDFVALHDADGTYCYVSPSVSRILGYTPEELIGTNPYQLFHPDDVHAIAQQSHQRAVEGKDIENIEYRIRKKDGQYIWLSTNTKAIIDSDGKVSMLQTVSRDVTERVQTLHLLEELNHQKSKLFSVIAHDLRGPLASCMGLLSLTQKDLPKEDLGKYLLMLKKSAFNMHELMEDLLLWAGSQLDRISFDPTILNVKEAIDVAYSRLVEIARNKGIMVDLQVEDDSLAVYADREMIRTIIRNLLSNAIKFTLPNGRVEIRAKAIDGYVEISVCDNGVGIKKDDIEKLFSKTSTFTTYGTSGERGTGLGLDICNDFVEKHKGKIWVESEFGKGSKFTFALREF